MVYLRKKHIKENRMCYEYGKSQDEYIGTIEFDIDESVDKEFSERNPEIKFYEGYNFCRLTTSALQGIAKFIREDKYPDNYLRATH